MKKIIYLLLLSCTVFGANEYKQPNNAIFYKTVKIPLLNASGIVTNTSGGQLGTVNPVPVANGGTNSTISLNNNRVIVSSGGTIGELNSAGAVDKVLTSNGLSSLPSFISVITPSAIDATSNANGFIIGSGNTLALEPASASFGGIVTTGSQTMAGAKTFSTSVATPSILDNSSGLTILTSSNQNLSLQSQNSGRMIFNNGEGLDISEISTPTRSAVNFDSLYFKSDHNLYTEANTALSSEFRFLPDKFYLLMETLFRLG